MRTAENATGTYEEEEREMRIEGEEEIASQEEEENEDEEEVLSATGTEQLTTTIDTSDATDTVQPTTTTNSYKCPHCEHTCKHTWNLKRHVRTVHHPTEAARSSSRISNKPTNRNHSPERNVSAMAENNPEEYPEDEENTADDDSSEDLISEDPEEDISETA